MKQSLVGLVSGLLFIGLEVGALHGAESSAPVRVEAGLVQGTSSGDSKVRTFKGVPFAAPPVGKLRWQPPQPGAAWQGVRNATDFQPRCMQARLFQDMVFRDSGPSEDCLYLNIWTPASSAEAHLPVMVWIFGGGFQAGAPSEPRQDGSNLAKKGVIVVTVNYRLGLFGFFSHPELTEESPNHASGNYGLMDQSAALQWVHKNIAAFGGDPENVTIFGESAGSISVSAQMASPLSKGLFKQAIGESGGLFMLNNPLPALAATEQDGAKFGQSIGAATLADLRAKPASELLDAASKDRSVRFWPNVDGYFMPATPTEIYSTGRQAHVALLAGWNTDEQGYGGLLGAVKPSQTAYTEKVQSLYGENAPAILKAYAAEGDEQAKLAARDLASDRFIAFSTWKWLDWQLETGGSPVYRYHFEQAPPQPEGQPTHGAYHSADIEYVFQTLDSKSLPWTAADRNLSNVISSYWTNFAKTGDPNGGDLPKWPAYSKADYSVMHLGLGGPAIAKPHAMPDTVRARYELLDQLSVKTANPASSR